MHRIFERQVEITPDAIAVQSGQHQWTYRELDSKANQLANALKQYNIGPEVPVAICVDRSLSMILGILGILKAGGAYVPLDPTYPSSRLALILQEVQSPLLLTQQPLISALPIETTPALCLDTDWDVIDRYSTQAPVNETTPDNLAYITYTSGSTGRPKGVEITHSNVQHYIRAIASVLDVHPQDTYLHTASFSFSASVRQLLVPLSLGAKSVIAAREQTRDPLSLLRLIQTENITIFDTVASVWHHLLDALEHLHPFQADTLLQSQLRTIVFSGGLLPCQLLHRLQERLQHRVQVVNVYGQTETIGVCAFPVPPDFQQQQGYVPVGYPYAHNKTYVLDESLQPVPPGETGELCVAGAALARGYFNNPDLNSTKFLANPFAQSLADAATFDRLYRTGDVARCLPNGSLEILGRLDQQVKLRGLRIELGEIELVLAQHPQVKEAAVAAREYESGEKYLIAYIVPKRSFQDVNQPELTQTLRQFLRDQLPEYMVPAAFVYLEAFFLTPNGKLDRLAFPAPIPEDFQAQSKGVAARDSVELRLLQIWEKVLGSASIGVTDDFFDVGGHSLLAVEVLVQVEKVFGVSLPLQTFLQAPTVAQMAAILQGDRTLPWSCLVPIRSEGTKRPFFCVHGAVGNVLNLKNLARHLDPSQPLYGLQAQGVDGRRLPRHNLTAMATDYIKAIRTVQPQGPYYLGGYSFGGLVAFEMAQQLVAQGQTVAQVILLDTYGWGTFGTLSGKRDYLLNMSVKDLWKQRFWNVVYSIGMLLGRPVPFEDLENYILHFHAYAKQCYVPQVYPGRLTLLRCSEPSLMMLDTYQLTLQHWYNRDPQHGWGKLAGAGLDIYDVPVDHVTMCASPVLAKTLQACLNGAMITSAATHVQKQQTHPYKRVVDNIPLVG